MTSGKLEVLLVNAQQLKDRRFLGRMSPCVLLQYGDQEQRSTIAKSQGRNPVWNTKFSFDGHQHTHKLILSIMDCHKFCCGIGEHRLGQAIIYVKDVISRGMEKGEAEIDRVKYRVVLQDKTYAGEISVLVKFSSTS